MELQDRVTVTLTGHGARILNERNKEFNNRWPKMKPFKTDYKEGDLFTSELHDIINSFEGHFHVGCNVCFKNITPAEKESSKSENIKKESLNFNGFLFAIDTLEKFSCPIISTDHMIVKLDKREEFVSIESYEMLGNAYKEAFDECTRLKAKLARIRKVIKE